MLVLATAACLCVSVAAMDKNTPPTAEECTTKCKDGAEHKFELKSSAYTCAYPGCYYWQCTVCHISYYMYDEKAVIPHQYRIIEEAAGKRTYKCLNCSNTYSIETNGLCKHEWTEPTPVEAGKTCGEEVKCTHKCTQCGAIEYVYVTVEHNFANLTRDCTKDEVCTICGEVKAGTGNKTHTVTKWEQYNDSMHKGKCANEGCDVVIYEAHETKTAYEGDCTKDVVCKCGAVILAGQTEHNKYPTFGGDNNPGWYYVVTSDGKHSRQCSNPGCEQPTYVDVHEAGKGTNCSLCGDTAVSDETAPDTTTAAPAETTTPATTEPVETSTTETVAPATTEAPTPETTEAVTSSEPHIGTVAPEPAKEGEVIVELGEETDAKINVDNITKTNLTVKNIVEEKFTEYAAYDINLVKDGAKVQPDGTVKVSIALPEGWSDVDVYHVDAGVMTKLETTVKDGYAIFNTTHFSVYVLVNNKSAATPASTETTGETAPADDIVLAPEASAETTGAFDGYEPDENTLLISPAPKTGELPDMTLAVTVTLVTSLLAASALVIVGKKGRK